MLDDGSAVCRGDALSGYLGDDAGTRSSSTAVAVSGIDGSATTAVQVGVGRWHACARLDDGAVRCWGYGPDGRLGNGTEIDAPQPVAVTGIDGSSASSTAIDLQVVDGRSCALLLDGSIRCWGENFDGLLPGGNPASTPTDLPGFGPGGVFAVGFELGSSNACGWTAPGALWCLGDNASGQLSDGVPGPRLTTATAVDTIDGSTRRAVGASLASQSLCALLDDGRVRCAGAVANGQLGLEGGTWSTQPRRVLAP